MSLPAVNFVDVSAMSLICFRFTEEAFQERTESRVLGPIMEKLRQEHSDVGCPLRKNELDVLNVLLCLESYLNIFIATPSVLSNLLANLQ